MADRQMDLFPRSGGPSDFREKRSGGLYGGKMDLNPVYFEWLAQQKDAERREQEILEAKGKADAPRQGRDFLRRLMGPLPSDPTPPPPEQQYLQGMRQTELNFPTDDARKKYMTDQWLKGVLSKGHFVEKPSTFTSIGDILKNLINVSPQLGGLRRFKGLRKLLKNVDPNINAVRGDPGIQKFLFPPQRRKSD